MASAYVEPPRATKSGKRWRVRYRLGGSDTPLLFGGSFKTKKEAQARRDVIAGHLAALRVPDLRLIDQTEHSPTLIEAR